MRNFENNLDEVRLKFCRTSVSSKKFRTADTYSDIPLPLIAMIRFAQMFLASIFLVSCVQGWLFSTTNWPVRTIGKVTCNGEPVPFVDIELMDDDLWFEDKMGETTADSNRAFQVAGSGRDLLSGKPEPYIRVCYSYSGSYGKLKVVGILKILRREKVSQRSYSSDINFGTINFDSDHCKAYIQFYKALKYYKDVAKSLLPYNTLYIQSKTLIHGGTPYSTTNTVRIPRNYNITFETAQHEFVHTIRHSFDGSLAHFLYDVVRYATESIIHKTFTFDFSSLILFAYILLSI